jgi:hypothetical protein
LTGRSFSLTNHANVNFHAPSSTLDFSSVKSAILVAVVTGTTRAVAGHAQDTAGVRCSPMVEDLTAGLFDETTYETLSCPSLAHLPLSHLFALRRAAGWRFGANQLQRSSDDRESSQL